MIVLGLDFETTGLDPEKDRVIEIGAVLWDWNRKIPLEMMSTLIYHDAGVLMDEKARACHGIQDSDLARYGQYFDEAWKKLLSMVACTPYVMAHNGNAFDKKFFFAEHTRFREIKVLEKIDSFYPVFDLKWLDTMTDIEYPESIATRKLVHLAAEHGFLNPFAHRAVFDVLTMLKVAGCYSIDEIIRNSQMKTMRVLAEGLDFLRRDETKSRGFKWNPDAKVWFKDVKENKVEIATKDLPFHVVVEKVT